MMISQYYILNGKEPVESASLLDWAKWFETANRHVADSRFEVFVFGALVDVVRVSTVFLGLDHNWEDHGDPVLFETMIFGGKEDQFQTRCCTWDEAEDMHEAAINIAKAGAGIFHKLRLVEERGVAVE